MVRGNLFVVYSLLHRNLWLCFAVATDTDDDDDNDDDDYVCGAVAVVVFLRRFYIDVRIEIFMHLHSCKLENVPTDIEHCKSRTI